MTIATIENGRRPGSTGCKLGDAPQDRGGRAVWNGRDHSVMPVDYISGREPLLRHEDEVTSLLSSFELSLHRDHPPHSPS